MGLVNFMKAGESLEMHIINIFAIIAAFAIMYIILHILMNFNQSFVVNLTEYVFLRFILLVITKGFPNTFGEFMIEFIMITALGSIVVWILQKLFYSLDLKYFIIIGFLIELVLSLIINIIL